MNERARKRRKGAKDWTGIETSHGKVVGEAGVGKWKLECRYCGDIHIVDSRPLIYDRHTRKCPAWKVHNYKGEDFDKWLRKKYGIDLFEYSQILASQGGKCAICGVTPEQFGRDLFVDHCHTTGKVRGLLCHSCNHGIGVFGENPSALLSAAEYVKQHAGAPAPAR